MFVLLLLQNFVNPKEETFLLCTDVVDMYTQLRQRIKALGHTLEKNKPVAESKQASALADVLLIHPPTSGRTAHKVLLHLPASETVVWMREIYPHSQLNALSICHEHICCIKFCIT